MPQFNVKLESSHGHGAEACPERNSIEPFSGCAESGPHVLALGAQRVSRSASEQWMHLALTHVVLTIAAALVTVMVGCWSQLEGTD